MVRTKQRSVEELMRPQTVAAIQFDHGKFHYISSSCDSFIYTCTTDSIDAGMPHGSETVVGVFKAPRGLQDLEVISELELCQQGSLTVWEVERKVLRKSDRLVVGCYEHNGTLRVGRLSQPVAALVPPPTMLACTAPCTALHHARHCMQGAKAVFGERFMWVGTPGDASVIPKLEVLGLALARVEPKTDGTCEVFWLDTVCVGDLEGTR